MSVTALEGIVENGQIRLRDPVHLAENTRVYIIIADAQAKPTAHLRSPRLADPAKATDFKKQIVELPSDA